MNTWSIDIDWQSGEDQTSALEQTRGFLKFVAGNINLTENKDIWSQQTHDRVLVSAYPLALWLASSWWRLRFEPLPARGHLPSIDWRMAHELPAANQGFVWPRVIFASDADSMQIWAVSSPPDSQQSVRYLNGLEYPVFLSFQEFETLAADFIARVITQLEATGSTETALASLWAEVQAERADPEAAIYRRREAELGFEPDEAPERLVKNALELAQQMGSETLSELIPTCGKDTSQSHQPQPLEAITKFIDRPGLQGSPEISQHDFLGKSSLEEKPWQRAKMIAHSLRQQLDINDQPIPDQTLCELLGLREQDYNNWHFDKEQKISVAVPKKQNQFSFHPQKRHPRGKRFELGRFIGDYCLYSNQGQDWLASTDLGTARQKYQRAFAAEFLCPLESLVDYLRNDYSESSLEDASDYFHVSTQTVESTLINNGVISKEAIGYYTETRLPY